MSLVARSFFCLACACAAMCAAPKVVVTGLTEAVFQDLKKSVPGVNLVNTTEATLLREIADADGVLGPIQPQHLKAARTSSGFTSTVRVLKTNCFRSWWKAMLWSPTPGPSTGYRSP